MFVEQEGTYLQRASVVICNLVFLLFLFFDPLITGGQIYIWNRISELSKVNNFFE